MSDFNHWLILYIILNIKSKKYIESNNVFIVCLNKSTNRPKKPPKWFYFVCDIKDVCYLGPILRFRQGSLENSLRSLPRYVSSSQRTSCSCAEKPLNSPQGELIPSSRLPPSQELPMPSWPRNCRVSWPCGTIPSPCSGPY